MGPSHGGVPNPADWRQIGIRLPVVISGRLDGLLANAHRAGLRTSRREMVAALAEVGLDTISAQSIRHYRTASVARGLLAGTGREQYRQPTRRPGPRGSTIGFTAGPPITPQQGCEQDEAERIVDGPAVRVGLALPSDVLARIEQVVANMQEDRPSRTELIAALILEGPEDGEKLAEIVRSFRRARSSALRREIDGG